MKPDDTASDPSAMPTSSPNRTKVAVLGGGVAGMSAAFELTATPALREKYEVTVHQMGWRLGGKGASGRNAAHGQRIEEHGLHVWFGFYDNAFDMIRRCYEELGRTAGTPLSNFDEAFAPCDEIVLGEEYRSEWLLHTFDVPRMPGLPGTVGALPTVWDLTARGLEWAVSAWDALELALERALGEHPKRSHWPDLLKRAAEHVEERLVDIESDVRTRLLHAAARLCHDLLGDPTGKAPGHVPLLSKLLTEFKDAVWDDFARHDLDHEDLRNFFMMLDLFVSMFAGIVTDDVIGNGFDPLNDKELRTWLGRHGMNPYTAEHSPVLRGFYSGGFAFEGGDKSRPNVAAGTAVHAILRIFTYKDSILRKMQAGMGDTIFAPMYQVLRNRGVNFEFFHRVTKLGLSDDASAVTTIELVQQTDLTVPEYRPLVNVADLDCWPSLPDWGQLRDGKALAASGINFEYGQDAPHASSIPLRVGTDFDEVVLAIPVAALPEICSELIANKLTPKFADMVAHTATTMTQAFQLWTDESADEMGWTHSENSILTAYVEPVDTYADMSHLLDRETWPPGVRVANIAYFCGVMADRPGESQADATQRAYDDAVEWLEGDMGPVWSGSDQSGRASFDWDLLVDQSGAAGPNRMREQYWRANFQPSERYTLSLTGTMKYRLAADESGYKNLVLAGDWIRNGIDAGCVEASVMSGMQASRAICGSPEFIVGEDHSWLEGNNT